MVYKKYIKRNGKFYGPYVYNSRRVNGKVISEYHGVEKKDYKKFILPVFGILFLMFLAFFMVNFKGNISGNAIANSEVNLSSDNSLVYPTVYFTLISHQKQDNQNNLTVQPENQNLPNNQSTNPLQENQSVLNSSADNSSNSNSSQTNSLQPMQSSNNSTIPPQINSSGSLTGNSPSVNSQQNNSDSQSLQINSSTQSTTKPSAEQNSTTTSPISSATPSTEQTSSTQTAQSSSSTPSQTSAGSTTSSSDNSASPTTASPESSSSSSVTTSAVSMPDSTTTSPISSATPSTEQTSSTQTAQSSSSTPSQTSEPTTTSQSSTTTSTSDSQTSSTTGTSTADSSSTATSTSNADSGTSAPITGGVISNILRTVSNFFLGFLRPTGLAVSNPNSQDKTINGEVSADKPFTYALSDGESVELVSGSVKTDTKTLPDDAIIISFEGNNVLIKTNYTESNNLQNETINKTAIENVSFNVPSLTDNEEKILENQFGNYSVGITKSELFNGKYIVGYQLGDYNIEYSYDPSLSNETLKNQMESDKIKWLRDIVNQLSKKIVEPQNYSI